VLILTPDVFNRVSLAEETCTSNLCKKRAPMHMTIIVWFVVFNSVLIGFLSMCHPYNIGIFLISGRCV